MMGEGEWRGVLYTIFSICQGNNHRHKHKRAPLFSHQSHPASVDRSINQSEASILSVQPIRSQQTALSSDLCSGGIETN